MAARSCHSCGMNWPTVSGYDPCPLCDEKTMYTYVKNSDFSQAEAKEYVAEYRAREELAREAVRTAPTPEHADRVARYLEMKFSEVDAQVLALAKWAESDSKGRKWVRPLDPLRVARALELGCTHAQAVDIFT
jgi:uncharacterized Zn finger protein (UPF0148 family)